jgi:hypothetical protein
MGNFCNKNNSLLITTLSSTISVSITHEQIQSEFAHNIFAIVTNSEFSIDDKRRHILRIYATYGIPNITTKFFILEEFAIQKISDVLWMQIWTQSPQNTFSDLLHTIIEHLIRTGYSMQIVDFLLKQCDYNRHFVKRLYKLININRNIYSQTLLDGYLFVIRNYELSPHISKICDKD